MKLTLEHVAAVLREQGLEEHVGAVLDALTRKPKQTPGAARQARYRERVTSQIASRDGVTVTPKVTGEISSSVTKSVTVTAKVTPLARVEDNLLPLEVSGLLSKISEADASLVNGVKWGGSEVKAKLLAFGEAWNALADQFKLPQIDEIKSGSLRERHALARLRELGSHDDLLVHIRGSPYLRGEVNGFRCTFDWMINVSNCQKIMEGNYEGRNQKNQSNGRYAYR